MSANTISIREASENNLRSVSLEIPKNQLVVVTGVSGSGKSSLVFDVIFREAERKYLSTFTTYARQFLQKTKTPEVRSVTGLAPAIAIDQHAITRNPRSTVGTLTEIYDYLRLLYARTSEPVNQWTSEPVGQWTSGPVNQWTSGQVNQWASEPENADPRIPGSPDRHATHDPIPHPPSDERRETPPPSRAFFSFNSPEGACPVCKGLGVEDSLDPELLIADASKSIREGALVITAPNGYIIYSQVTLDVLNQVCEAEGFNIDIPWQEMTDFQKHVILYGSEKLEVPFGKHTLESRMRWSGITAKPREMGYYKGVIPVMETILKRERNKNILRFVRSRTCHACEGRRLRPEALGYEIHGKNIAELNQMSLSELQTTLTDWQFQDSRQKIAQPILQTILKRIETLENLGLDYLTCARESTTLSPGESQRIRLAVQLETNLQGLLYIFDEPSIGLHPADALKIINALKKLRDKGNSVIVVEHEEAFIRAADHLIDIGPGAGTHGGEVLVNCAVSELDSLPEEVVKSSATLNAMRDVGWAMEDVRGARREALLQVFGASLHNLQNIDVTFIPHALNVVTGVSGAGKSSLVNGIIGKRIQGSFREMAGWDQIRKTISIDQTPIGKTSRSNPATYTGLFDLIRDLFASLPDAKARKFSKSRFSFNTKGGRCPDCEGTGYHQFGMHFLGTVEVPCDTCGGKQFNEETLEIRYQGKNIADVLEMPVSEALPFFRDQKKIAHGLEVLDALGLGYLHLGQRSSTLSGGEAQRIKLATELSKPATGHTLYLLDEPTTGLHPADVNNLLNALNSLVQKKHTVILIEHDPALILSAAHVLDLGPGSGKNGGSIVAAGTPQTILNTPESLTGQALNQYLSPDRPNAVRPGIVEHSETSDQPNAVRPHIVERSETSITLSNVTTHNLKGISCSIPHNQITVITGISGSGKSSLAFDTLVAEGQNRFLGSFSAYARSRIGIKPEPEADRITGLTPTFAVDQRNPGNNPRSTIGTFTGIYDLLRLLYARASTPVDTRAPDHTSHIPHRTSAERSETQRPNEVRPIPNMLSSLFSFNDSSGACPTCGGLGKIVTCDPEKLITHPEKPLTNGAMDGTKTGKFYGEPHGQYISTLLAVGERHQFDYTQPWNTLSERAKNLAMEGTGDEEYEVVWHFKRKERTGEHHFKGKWIGFIALVDEEYQRKHADHRGNEIKPLLREIECHACQGQRLNQKALSYKIDGHTIATLTRMPVSELTHLLPQSIHSIDPGLAMAVKPLIREILGRLSMLQQFNLGYITLDRPIDTLSGGVFQRLKLAQQSGSGLTGITYVLDEPATGLFPSEIPQLMNQIKALRDEGNTMILVEHHPEIIREADHVIDLGPGAGSLGGEILAEGPPSSMVQNPKSVTGPYLSDHQISENHTNPPGISSTAVHKNRHLKPGIVVEKAFAHNLKEISVTIPLGGIVAITGPSGSGKASLLFDVLLKSLETGKPQGCDDIREAENRNQANRETDIREAENRNQATRETDIREAEQKIPENTIKALLSNGTIGKVVPVLQKRHFDDTRGTPITYVSLFDPIRKLFAQTPEAKAQKLGKSHFSWLSPAGRCETCNGHGEIRISLDFMADVRIPCESCDGTRFKPASLTSRVHEKTIADILAMSFSEAIRFFDNPESSPAEKDLREHLRLLEEIGLGYLKLGQPLNTLSGGEAQRLTLVRELVAPTKPNQLFIFHEPSQGLHPADLPRLQALFDKLIGQGNSIWMIEQNPRMLLNADWILKLGPGAGHDGGTLVFEGQVADLLLHDTSLTDFFSG